MIKSLLRNESHEANRMQNGGDHLIMQLQAGKKQKKNEKGYAYIKSDLSGACGIQTKFLWVVGCGLLWYPTSWALPPA